jgi:hypothetical protein
MLLIAVVAVVAEVKVIHPVLLQLFEEGLVGQVVRACK